MIGNIIVSLIGYGLATALAVYCALSLYLLNDQDWRTLREGHLRAWREPIIQVTCAILALAFAGITKWMTGL